MSDRKYVDEPLAIVRSDVLDDWWLIERAEHDGGVWFEDIPGIAYARKLMASSRISDADIEGSAVEMRTIARGILEGVGASFKRCAAEPDGDFWLLYSPRNSTVGAMVPKARAEALARDILAHLSPNQSLSHEPT